jgi:hypothetical protein
MATIMKFAAALKKQKLPLRETVFLGIINDFSRMSEGIIRLVPTENKLSKSTARLEGVLSSGKLDQKELNSIRGDLVFLACSSYDKAVRGGFKLMANHNIRADGFIHASLRLGCLFFLKLFRELKPRIIIALITPTKPILLYTDACWEWSSLKLDAGLGAVFFFPSGAVRKFYSQTPPELLQVLKPRKTQITPIELVTPIVAIETLAAELVGAKIIAFIDNLPAASCLVSGHSTQMDLQCMTTLFHKALLRLQIRLWVEWIPSAENVADDTSRGKDSPTAELQFPQWLFDPLTYPQLVVAWTSKDFLNTKKRKHDTHSEGVNPYFRVLPASTRRMTRKSAR